MTKEKAVIMALEIVDTCKTYSDEEKCPYCPFNIVGCMLTDGNNIPTDWRANELIKCFEIESRRARKNERHRH